MTELQEAATQHTQAIETKQAELERLGQAKVGAWEQSGEALLGLSADCALATACHLPLPCPGC